MSPKYSIDHTTIILNPEKLQALLGTETLVICGAARGMTSVVSYTLYNMNYFLGDNLGPDNYEDKEMLACLPDTRTIERGLKPGSFKKFNALVAKRNRDHARWGFKLPNAAFYAPMLSRRLRNPVFMICVRNPMSTMTSIFNREPALGISFNKAFERSVDYLSATRSLMDQTHIPVIYVNMDAVQRRPGRFLNEIAPLLDIDGNKHKIREQIAKPGYSRSE